MKSTCPSDRRGIKKSLALMQAAIKIESEPQIGGACSDALARGGGYCIGQNQAENMSIGGPLQPKRKFVPGIGGMVAGDARCPLGYECCPRAKSNAGAKTNGSLVFTRLPFSTCRRAGIEVVRPQADNWDHKQFSNI